MKIHNFYLLLFLLISINNVSGQYEWTQKANFGGGARMAAVSFAIGNKGYVGTGWDGNNLYKDFWEYDPSTDIWTQKADFGGAARFSAIEFVIDSLGYVGLGSSGYPDYIWSTDFWMYDPVSNAWTQKNNFPGSGRYDAARFAINRKGYIGTGWDGAFFNDLWEYDPVADAWTQEADFPGTPRSSTAYFSCLGKGYIGMGAEETVYYSDIYQYDPTTNSWIQKNNFPGDPRNNTSNFSIGNFAYVGLGSTNYPNSAFLNDFWKYDPSSDSWNQIISYPGAPRFHPASFVINCSAYVGIGYGATYYNNFWQLNTCAALPPTASFQSSDSVLCANDCIAFSDLSSNATSWKWLFPGATPDSSTDENPQTICYFVSGNYNVTLIASNTDGSDTLQLTNYIKVNPTPPYPVIIQSHDTLICSYNPSYISYQWYYYNTPITGQIDTSLVAYYSGNYNLKVTNKYGCAISVGINIILGIDEQETNNYFTIYPNPASDNLTISINKNFHNVELEIFDIYGRRLVQRTIESTKDNNLTVDFRSFASGAYFVSMNVNGERITKKVVKESSSE